MLALFGSEERGWSYNKIKKFDGTDMFGMVLFIIVAEEVMESYNVGDNADADMQSPDEVTVMFNNLVEPARDWVRTQRETAPNVIRSPRVFKDVLMAKYFGSDKESVFSLQ